MMIFNPLCLALGLQYVRAKRTNSFISFVSLVSMMGIALGVTVLITVTSVMNGFSKEIRAKMLSVTPHLVVESAAGISDWQGLTEKILQDKRIESALPYVEGQGMLVRRGKVEGVQVKGIVPEYVSDGFDLREQMVVGDTSSLIAKDYNIILGDILAMQLGLDLGDKVSLMVPEAQVTPGGIIPRVRQFTISGIFHTGTVIDRRGAFINFTDASVLYRTRQRATAIQFKLEDISEAKSISNSLANDEMFLGYRIYDWTDINGDFFNAVKMEKTVMTTILTLVVAVAVFNLVSSLVMLVNDKRGDIAIMRTMGFSSKSIMLTFIVTGMIIGTVGTALGFVGGLWLATNASWLVAELERLLGTNLISEGVYLVDYLPSEIHQSDVVLICSIALILSFISTIYPALTASRVQPGEALKNEH